VPPNHEYAVATETNDEFESLRFVPLEPTELRRAVVRTRRSRRNIARVTQTAVPGGACDTAQRRAADCQAQGKTSTCRVEQNICIGGLTEDQGETDFLNFFVSRLNIYSDSLTVSELPGRMAVRRPLRPSLATRPIRRSATAAKVRIATSPPSAARCRSTSHRAADHVPAHAELPAVTSCGVRSMRWVSGTKR